MPLSIECTNAVVPSDWDGRLSLSPDSHIKQSARYANFYSSFFQSKALYLTAVSGQEVVALMLAGPVGMTAALALGTWIPGAAAALRRADLALPGTDHWTVLARARNGAAVCAHGRGQSHATAVMAAGAARTAPTLPAGVHSSHQVLTLSDVPTDQGISVCRPQRRAHRTSENESE